MNRYRLYIAYTFLACGAACAGTLATPNIFTSAEAPGAINLLPGSGAGQKQLWIINSDQFGSLGASSQITGLAMRPNCDDPSCSFPGSAFGSTTIQNLQITLAVTSFGPGNVFSDNNFADYLTGAVAVFNGNAVVSSSDSGPALGPKAFDILFPFTTPFNYNPAAGNLVVQFAVNSSGGIPSFIDGLQDGSGKLGRLFGTYAASTGQGDTFGPVLDFTFQNGSTAPEPATWLLPMPGLIALLALRRSRPAPNQR